MKSPLYKNHQRRVHIYKTEVGNFDKYRDIIMCPIYKSYILPDPSKGITKKEKVVKEANL